MQWLHKIQIWTPRVGCPDESTLNQLAKQILNGEVMRTTETVESKMVVLQEEGLLKKAPISPE
jgi:hypothetical protein